MGLSPGGFAHGEAFDPSKCDCYELYKSLATRPLGELTFSDYLLLTGHSKCCGTRLRKEAEKYKEAEQYYDPELKSKLFGDDDA